jgi:prophage regulatory protein
MMALAVVRPTHAPLRGLGARHAREVRTTALPSDRRSRAPTEARKEAPDRNDPRPARSGDARPIDQVLSTRDIVMITGRHRITIYRWIRAGIFPRKHEAHGHKVGWLRSDVEQWLRRGTQRPENSSKSG